MATERGERSKGLKALRPVCRRDRMARGEISKPYSAPAATPVTETRWDRAANDRGVRSSGLSDLQTETRRECTLDSGESSPGPMPHSETRCERPRSGERCNELDEVRLDRGEMPGTPLFARMDRDDVWAWEVAELKSSTSWPEKQEIREDTGLKPLGSSSAKSENPVTSGGRSVKPMPPAPTRKCVRDKAPVLRYCTTTRWAIIGQPVRALCSSIA
mmetsp:Transcript_147810/g.375612  ORF Transcript_147810/g.375612 Transcript_147810/m.375612 type:complete len:216 (-) Transcript_147810:1-648(-)